MISWSKKRQTFYIVTAMVFFILVVGLPVFFATYKPPSCSDGKQNQNEKGVDCGGPCSVLCKASALDLIGGISVMKSLNLLIAERNQPSVAPVSW
jgi:hypothetical protein